MTSSLNSIPPSFTVNSSNLADIAASVVEEFRSYKDADSIYFEYGPIEDKSDSSSTETLRQSEDKSESDSDEGFEFLVFHTDHNSTIRFPIFGQSLLLNKSDSNKPVRHSLGELFKLETETLSCLSPKADELNGVSPGTCYIWKPKTESVFIYNTNCKKSNATRSSSKWLRFRSLLNRSNNDISVSTNNKDASVSVVSRLTATKKRAEKVKKVEKKAKVVGVDDDEGERVTVNRTVREREGNRIRSYLSYKPDLVGAFGNVNGLSRNSKFASVLNCLIG